MPSKNSERLPRHVYAQHIKGHTYYRFRKTGGGSIRLHGTPGAADFRAAYERALAAYGPAGAGFIYFIRAGQNGGRIKIGFSTQPSRRCEQLATGNAERLELLGAVCGTRADERALHRRFSEYREKGEWFSGEITPQINEILEAQCTVFWPLPNPGEA